MQQVKRIVSILEVLGDKTDGIGLTGISKEVDLSKSTAFRILKSLMEHNMVTQDKETKKYKLGLQMMILGSKAIQNLGIREIVRPHLLNLRNKFNETCFLSVLNNNKVTCAEKVDTNKKLRYFVQEGNTMPYNCAASAKAIIAFQDKEKLKKIMDSMKFLRYTDHTVYNEKKLLLEYEKIKDQGFAICDEEMEEQVLSIAVPLFDYDSKVRASICLLGLKSSFQGERLNEVITSLKKTGESIGTVLKKL